MRAAPARSWLPPFVLLALIWGCSFLLIQLGLRSLTPVGVAFGRLVLGAITLLLVSAVTRTALPPRGVWRHLFVVALLLNSVPFTLFAYGETQISSSLAGIINGAAPLTTVLVVLVAFPEEKPTRERLAGLLLGFLGVVVVLGVWRGLGDGQWLGIGACVLAVCCYGLAFPYARRHLAGAAGPVSLATGQVCFGALQLVPAVALTGLTSGPLVASAAWGMLALGCLGSGLAYVLNFRVVAAAGSTTASMVTYATPVVAVIVGVAFLAEQPQWNELVGTAVVVAGAALAQGRPRRRARDGATNAHRLSTRHPDALVQDRRR